MVRLQHSTVEEKLENDIAPNKEELETKLKERVQHLLDFANTPIKEEHGLTLQKFEGAIKPLIFEIGCTVISLFLFSSESHLSKQTPISVVQQGKAFEKKKPKPRTIMTWFGTVRYWRTYMAAKGNGKGFYPLDHILGLTKDSFSFSILATTVRLATMLPFATAKTTAELFLAEVPSTQVMEKATLGFGRYTQQWFEYCPAPEDDGDVLIILFDGKGTPRATDDELFLRRGKREKGHLATSPRHRGRHKGGCRRKKKRRNPNDKSKNAPMATMVVMYTLKTEGNELYGPNNKWHYASFGPKKHAFAAAFREARKRGFAPESDDVIQIVTDGDEDLARYTKLFFPNAIHTLDIMHVIERLWKAGACLFRVGSKAQQQWVEEQKDRLYNGEIKDVIRHLQLSRRKLSGSKKNKDQRKKRKEHINYLAKRIDMMNYSELHDEDLEIGSGAVEGAVKYIIGKRCDQGGMRWIVERNEAVVQLRCIEVNGHWEQFCKFVHEYMRTKQLNDSSPIRIQQHKAEPLPDMVEPPEWKKAS